MLIVSSCLAGQACRYNGTHALQLKLVRLVEEQKAIMLCPELLGGFVTPREPAEIVGGTGEDVLSGKARIIGKSGTDVTDMYLAGAQRTLQWAREVQATCIVLKENSPSCGSQNIYSGQFNNQRISGEGVTTALLRREGFKVISEHQLEQICDQL